VVKLIITGDVDLMNVADAQAPFRRVKDAFRSADLVFSNLECCLTSKANEGSTHVEGFFADPRVTAPALTECGIAAVGIANNVNYGEAINESIAHLDHRHRAHWRRRKPHTAARPRWSSVGIEDRVAARWSIGPNPRDERPSASIAVMAATPPIRSRCTR
jgi:poly-gamma-glutamate synthesis protein (capsule biosynthesis protein)